MNDAQIQYMVNRFLGWCLPKPWNPDNGVSYNRPNYAHPPAEHDWPVGTNLFDATQAEAMVRYMVEGLDDFNEQRLYKGNESAFREGRRAAIDAIKEHLFAGGPNLVVHLPANSPYLRWVLMDQPPKGAEGAGFYGPARNTGRANESLAGEPETTVRPNHGKDAAE